MSAVRLSSSLKTSTFSIKECEKHFQYVCYLADSTTKLSKIFRTNNTLAGHCSPRIEKIALRDGERRIKQCYSIEALYSIIETSAASRQPRSSSLTVMRRLPAICTSSTYTTPSAQRTPK